VPLQPDTDAALERTGSRQRTAGARFLLVGGVLFAIGLVLMLATSDFGDFVGIALAALATPFTLVGAALLASGLVARRASAHRPFA
jgi:hypothetical protein